jgi:pimeloyl-ACP methyl ester carboxylesterase
MSRRRSSAAPPIGGGGGPPVEDHNPLLSAAMKWNWKWKGYSINPARLGMRIWKTTADVARELTKAVVREVFASAFRTADAGCAIILEWLHSAGYYQSRKERIRRIEEGSFSRESSSSSLAGFITAPLTSDIDDRPLTTEDDDLSSAIEAKDDEFSAVPADASAVYGPPHSRNFVEEKFGTSSYRTSGARVPGMSVSDSEERHFGGGRRRPSFAKKKQVYRNKAKKGELAIQRTSLNSGLLTLPFPRVEVDEWRNIERKEQFSGTESDDREDSKQSYVSRRSSLFHVVASRRGEQGLYNMSVANAFSSRQTGFFEDIQLLVLTIVDEAYDLSLVLGQGVFARVNAVLMTLWNSREQLSSKDVKASLIVLKDNLGSLSQAVRISRAQINSEEKSDVSVFIPVVEAVLRLIEGLTGPIQDRLTQLVFGGLDDRSFHDFVLSVGYPYEYYDVTTEDGYILPLDRIPRKGSTCHKVVYFQHGVMDTAYAWISGTSGELATNCAFTAFNDGCDVFLGNFRGNRNMAHSNPYITAKEYWDFSLNEHARYDMWAFVERIRDIKLKEGVPEDKLEITLVGHSLGGAVSLAYIVWKKMLRQPHHLKKMILMSPAGFHHKIPFFCQLTGPIIKATLAKVISGVRLPSAALIAVFSKVMQDLRKVPAARDLISFMITQLVGGDVNESAFTRIGNLTFNLLLSGTSSKLFLHFWHIYQVQRFELFDYGDAFRNWMEYGSAKPPNLLENYHLIDIPVHFLSGEHDHLIPPEDVYVQYQALKYFHPELARFQCFEKASHLHFTYSQNDDLIAYLNKELGS